MVINGYRCFWLPVTRGARWSRGSRRGGVVGGLLARCVLPVAILGTRAGQRRLGAAGLAPAGDRGRGRDEAGRYRFNPFSSRFQHVQSRRYDLGLRPCGEVQRVSVDDHGMPLNDYRIRSGAVLVWNQGIREPWDAVTALRVPEAGKDSAASTRTRSSPLDHSAR